MENVRTHRHIKLVTTNRKKIRLVAQPNFHTTKCFLERLLEMNKTKKKNIQVLYLGLSVLDMSKIVMYE